MQTPSRRPRILQNFSTPEQYVSGFSGVATLKIDQRHRLTFPKNTVRYEQKGCLNDPSFVPVILPKSPGVIFLIPRSFLNPTAALNPNGAEIYSSIELDSMHRFVIPIAAMGTFQIPEDRTVFLAGKGPYCVLSTMRETPQLTPQLLRTILHPVLFEKLFPQPAANDAQMVPKNLADFLEAKICELLGLQPGGTVTVAGVQVNVSLSVRIAVVGSDGEPS